MQLTDIHKQKLWADFLMWSGGKSFYEIPMEPGVEDFIGDHVNIVGWLNTLPKSWHKPLVEWVKSLKDAHEKRDKAIFDSYSKDIMYQKEWSNGYPTKFDQRGGEPELLDFSQDSIVIILQNYLQEQLVGSEKLPLKIMSSNNGKKFTTAGFSLLKRPNHRILSVVFKEGLELPILILQDKFVDVSKLKISANIVTALNDVENVVKVIINRADWYAETLNMIKNESANGRDFDNWIADHKEDLMKHKLNPNIYGADLLNELAVTYESELE